MTLNPYWPQRIVDSKTSLHHVESVLRSTVNAEVFLSTGRVTAGTLCRILRLNDDQCARLTPRVCLTLEQCVKPPSVTPFRCQNRRCSFNHTI